MNAIPLTREDAGRFLTEITEPGRTDWLDAPGLWDKLKGGESQKYHSTGLIGVFFWSGDGIYFGCGEGCCDDEINKRDEFAKMYEGKKFIPLKRFV